MSRLKDLGKYVNKELLKLDEKTAWDATIHLYGVSLVATMIAKERLKLSVQQFVVTTITGQRRFHLIGDRQHIKFERKGMILHVT